MNCQDISLILDDRDVNELTRSEKESVAAHIGHCHECADDWRVHERQLSRVIPSMPADLPQGVWQRLEATLPATGLRRRFTRPMMLGGLLLVGAAAATIVAIQSAQQSLEATALTATAETDEQSAESTSGEPDTLPVGGEAADAVAAEGSSVAMDGLTSPQADISLDLASVAVLPVMLVNTDSESLLSAANDVRADIVRRLEESEQLNLIDPALVQTYLDGGLTDLEVGQTLGVGTLVFVRGEKRDGRAMLDFGTLDPATDQELYYGSVGVTEGALSAAAIRINESNAANLIERLQLAAYPDLATSREESIENNQAVVLNSSLSSRDRIDALAELRFLGPEARSDAMVAAAIEIAMSSDDPSLRNRAWFTLVDVDNPSIVQPLLNVLRYDSSDTVRSVAVRLLSEYAEEPDVRQALEFAAAQDESPGVREQAELAALPDRERYERVRSTFFDRNRPARDRVGSLQSYFGSIGPGLLIDPDIADELLRIELDPAVGTTGAGTLLYYADRLDPKLVDPLLTLLAEAPEHRALAASLLSHFNNQPVVVEALQRALDDPDRNVRNNAQRALERAR